MLSARRWGAYSNYIPFPLVCLYYTYCLWFHIIQWEYHWQTWCSTILRYSCSFIKKITHRRFGDNGSLNQNSSQFPLTVSIKLSIKLPKQGNTPPPKASEKVQVRKLWTRGKSGYAFCSPSPISIDRVLMESSWGCRGVCHLPRLGNHQSSNTCSWQVPS